MCMKWFKLSMSRLRADTMSTTKHFHVHMTENPQRKKDQIRSFLPLKYFINSLQCNMFTAPFCSDYLLTKGFISFLFCSLSKQLCKCKCAIYTQLCALKQFLTLVRRLMLWKMSAWASNPGAVPASRPVIHPTDSPTSSIYKVITTQINTSTFSACQYYLNNQLLWIKVTAGSQRWKISPS